MGRKKKLQCGQCQLYYHMSCGNITEVEARIMQAEKNPWICEICAASTRSTSRKSMNMTSRNSSFLEASTELDRDRRRSVLCSDQSRSPDPELKLVIRALQDEVRELRKAMEFFNEKYEEEARRAKFLTEIVNQIKRQ